MLLNAEVVLFEELNATDKNVALEKLGYYDITTTKALLDAFEFIRLTHKGKTIGLFESSYDSPYSEGSYDYSWVVDYITKAYKIGFADGSSL